MRRFVLDMGRLLFGHGAFAVWSCGVLKSSCGVSLSVMGRKHPRGGEVENGKLPPHVFRGRRFAVHTFKQSASSLCRLHPDIGNGGDVAHWSKKKSESGGKGRAALMLRCVARTDPFV